MTLVRLGLSAVLWWAGALVVCLAAKVGPKVHRPAQRFEADGMRLVAELPRERILVPVEAWHSGLVLHAAFHRFGVEEARA